MDENQDIVPTEEQNVVVYQNGVTSIDFMCPEDERQILEQNLNVYSNQESMEKTLKIAKKNMRLRQSVKDLQALEKLSDIIDTANDIQKEMLKEVYKPEYFRALAQKKPEEAFKAYKHFTDSVNSLVMAKEEYNKRITGNTSNKKFKIALKFSNGSGEDIALGMESE